MLFENDLLGEFFERKAQIDSENVIDVIWDW